MLPMLYNQILSVLPIPTGVHKQLAVALHSAAHPPLTALIHSVLFPTPVPPVGVRKQLVVPLHSAQPPGTALGHSVVSGLPDPPTHPPVLDHAEPILCLHSDLFSIRISQPEPEEICLGCDSFLMEHPSLSSEWNSSRNLKPSH